MAAELEDERNQKRKAKLRDREAAQKVINDNLAEKKKRLADEELSRQKEISQIKANMDLAIKKEKQREQEMQDRSKKIQDMMDSMADVVKDNGKELQRK